MKSNLWRLDMPSENTKKDYLERFLEKLRDRIKNCELSSDFIEELIPRGSDLGILEQLLVEEPKKLINLNDRLMRKFMGLQSPPTKKQIEDVFNYSGFLSRNKNNSYWLAKKIERNTCVYCNRLYIFTAEGTAPDNKYITRPVFDHWFPKSEYPLLSMSLFNLIPSCPICNSSLKGAKELNIDDYFHPYIHDKEPRIAFRVSKMDLPDSEWTVLLDCGNRKKEMNTAEAFGLNEIYASHRSLEVKDFIKFHSAYPQGYLHTLFTRILEKSGDKMSKEEVFRFFFGTEMESDKHLDRPLSKMKYDILKYLGLINK